MGKIYMSLNGVVIQSDVAEGEKLDRSPIYNTVFHYHLWRPLTTEIHLEVCVYKIIFSRYLYQGLLLFMQNIFAFFFNSGVEQNATLLLESVLICVFSNNCIADSKAFWELQSSDLQKWSDNFQSIFCSHAWRLCQRNTEACKITGQLMQIVLNIFSRISHCFIRHLYWVWKSGSWILVS